MRITTILLATAAGIGLMSSAYAADLIIEEEPLPVVEEVVVDDWTGAYIGAHVGWGVGTVDALYDDAFDDFEDPYDLEGWLAGVQAGANFQMDMFVLGIEGDAAWTNISGDSTDVGAGDIITTDLDWIATLRGRAGVAFDQVMIYATAGVAATGITHSVDDDFGPDVTPISDTRFGWVAGIGAAVKVTENVSVQGDLLFHDFGEETYSFDNGADLTESTTVTTAKIGLNFHF